MYELEYVNLDEQCGTKVHISSLHTTLGLQLNLDQPIFNSAQIITIPTKANVYKLIFCALIYQLYGTDPSRVELLVLCKQVSLESITDTRPPKVMPMVGAFRSCSRVYS
jgi:hypothetical protein